MIGRFDTIFWDVDGTLLDFEGSEDIGLKKCFLERGIDINEKQLELYKKINKDYWKRFDEGRVSKEVLYPGRFKDFFDAIGAKGIDPVKMNEDYQAALGAYPVCWEDTISVLEDFKGSVRQYATTNGSIVAQENKLRVSGIGKLLDGVFISEKIGTQKPNKEYFDYIDKAIGGINPKSTVIIGDSLSSDIRGGNNIGIASIWFNPKKEPYLEGSIYDATVTKLSEIRAILEKL